LVRPQSARSASPRAGFIGDPVNAVVRRLVVVNKRCHANISLPKTYKFAIIQMQFTILNFTDSTNYGDVVPTI